MIHYFRTKHYKMEFYRLNEHDRGKRPVMLPPFKNDFHLRNFGYNHKKSTKERREVLRDAADTVGDTLAVYRRLNLAKNKQRDSEIRGIMAEDAEYMRTYYRKTKKQIGGHDESIVVFPEEEYDNMLRQKAGHDESIVVFPEEEYDNMLRPPKFHDESIMVMPEEQWDDAFHRGGGNDEDDDVNFIKLPEVIDDIQRDVNESHVVDEHHIKYYTLTERDIGEILDLDQIFMDDARKEDDVSANLTKNKNRLIGIRDENGLQGYCQYEPTENNEVNIVWFSANKTFRGPLYIFMEKYFQSKKYTRIIITFSLDGKYAIPNMNFWTRVHFRTFKINTANNTISMDKLI